MKKFKVIPLILSCLVCSTLPAERDAVKSALTFSVFPLDRDADWSEIYYAPDGNPANGTVELSFRPGQRSMHYSYQGPEPLILFRREPTHTGELGFRILSRLRFTPDSRDPYIFFLQKMNNGERLSALVLRESPDTFPDDSLVFVNATDHVLYGLFSENQMRLPPGISPPVPLSAFFGRPVPITLAVRENDDAKMVMGNSFRFFPARKNILILRRSDNHAVFRVTAQHVTERVTTD